MWWIVWCGGLIATAVALYRAHARRALDDLLSARTRIVLLNAQLSQAQASMESLADADALRRKSAEDHLSTVRHRLDDVTVLERKFAARYEQTIPRLAARVLFLPAPGP